VKFAFLDDYRGGLSRAHACRVMGVTDRGLRAWKHRPLSHRQRRDMVLLAHIRNQHRLSQGSYGRPRMTEELNELGLRVGHRRVGRLMRQNAICVIRTHKFKATTDSDHTFNIAPNLLQQDFAASQPNQNRRSAQRNGRVTSMSGRGRAGSIWPSSWTCILAG
jgi:putative transposase